MSARLSVSKRINTRLKENSMKPLEKIRILSNDYESSRTDIEATLQAIIDRVNKYGEALELITVSLERAAGILD